MTERRSEINVLVVEDSVAEAQLVLDSLAFARRPAFAARHVTRIADAVRSLSRSPADVVVLDLGLPDAHRLEGFETIREAAPNAAIVVRAGFGDDRLALEALEAGALDYIMKTAHADQRGLERSILYALARRQAEEATRRLAAIVESSEDAIVSYDTDGTITSFNPAAEQLFGYISAEAIGKPVAMLVPDDRAIQERALLERVLSGERATHYETRARCKDGREVEVSLAVSAVLDDHERIVGVSMIARDVTERRRHEAQLEHLADHDALTGLLNRRAFSRALQAHAGLVERYGPSGCVLMIDLDHFKLVNDTLGHQAGDELIAAVAELIAARLRSSDSLARLGGDEFGVLLAKTTPDDARTVADGLLETLHEDAVTIGGTSRRVTASIGIASFGDAVDARADNVLINADLALYDAKESGRDRVAVFSTQQDSQARMKRRVNWAQRIESALESDRFLLLAQPIIDLATGRTTQYELLLRMIDERDELIAPGLFLDVAERLDLIQQIDAWVVGVGIPLAAELRADTPDVAVEINLSGRSLSDGGLLALIESELASSGVPAESIIFEITETAAISNIAGARAFTEHLADLGCRFALDDFGAGFGSFFYLKHMACDFLKIDGEFVRGCVANKTDRLVIGAVVDIARGMGKQTIAEFVEDGETMDLLADLGVDYGQGFHLGKPSRLTAQLVTG